MDDLELARMVAESALTEAKTWPGFSEHIAEIVQKIKETKMMKGQKLKDYVKECYESVVQTPSVSELERWFRL